MLNPILVYILTAIISGGLGFYISNNFNKSAYAKTDKSGDFGAPRGGFFALVSGSIIGVMLISLGSNFGFISPEAGGIGFIIALVLGAIGGLVGLFRGTRNR